MTGCPDLSDEDYRALAEFRRELRRFLHFSEQSARAAGLEPQQHQLLLALRGLAPDQAAPVGAIADWLQIQHHSAVELVDRAAEHGLVVREPDTVDRRRVLVRLTPRGQAVLRDLSLRHQAELRSAAPALLAALGPLLGAQAPANPEPQEVS